MAPQFCSRKLEELSQLIHFNGTLVSTFSVLNLIFSLVATLGNVLVIHALWKASTVPNNLKMLLLSLAFSDLAVGLIAQLLYGVIMAVMLRMAASENSNVYLLCPTILSVYYFFLFFLACASSMNITAIAVDRLLAVSFHLRYQELVTSKRITTAVVSFWLTSAFAASIYVIHSDTSIMVIVIMEVVVLLLTTAAYIRIYTAVRYHQNQIQCQLPADNRARELLRQKKSAFNVLFVYIVFVACYLPHFCFSLLRMAEKTQISFLAATHATTNIILLNSSLNPLVYCWRYREIRVIAKSTVKKIFRITET